MYQVVPPALYRFSRTNHILDMYRLSCIEPNTYNFAQLFQRKEETARQLQVQGKSILPCFFQNRSQNGRN